MMKNINTINERILELIDFKGFSSKRKFAESIGFAPQVLQNIVAGRKTKPSFDVIKAILTTFDDVSSEWFIRGDGEILKNNVGQSPQLVEVENIVAEEPAPYGVNWRDLYIAETGKVKLLEKQLEAEQKKTQRFNDIDNVNNYKKK